MAKKLLKQANESDRMIRKIRYMDGRKVYYVYKLVDVQEYKHAHGQDIKRKGGSEN